MIKVLEEHYYIIEHLGLYPGCTVVYDDQREVGDAIIPEWTPGKLLEIEQRGGVTVDWGNGVIEKDIDPNGLEKFDPDWNPPEIEIVTKQERAYEIAVNALRTIADHDTDTYSSSVAGEALKRIKRQMTRLPHAEVQPGDVLLNAHAALPERCKVLSAGRTAQGRVLLKLDLGGGRTMMWTGKTDAMVSVERKA